MDGNGILLFFWTLGVLLVVGIVGYAMDELHQRQVENKDDLDRELRELIGEEK